jgi:hypothetical protein
MKVPQYKIDLGGTEYTTGFPNVNVKLRENNYSVATLIIDNEYCDFYTDKVNSFDEIKIYAKDYWRTSYTQIFGGWARELLPAFSTTGNILTLGCKGYGSALDETYCNRDYGYESKVGASYDELSEILDDVVNDFAEKSFDDWATGHTFDHTLITDNFDATTFTFINNPYRKTSAIINHVCDLATAIAAGADAENPTAAGPHWIVDPSKYFMVAKIGDHAAGANSPEARWPDWWNTDQTGSTLTEGIDFQSLQVYDKSSEFSNSVILYTDFRRPSYDYWTEDSGGQALWGNNGWASITDSAVKVVVGSHSLLFTATVTGNNWGYYPSTKDAAWDFEKIGSEESIPHVNFYFYASSSPLIPVATTWIELFTTDEAVNYFYSPFATNATLDTWTHCSIPVGPYWKSAEYNTLFNWQSAGAPLWSNISGISFYTAFAPANALLYIDDLHITGKVARQAYVSDNITANKEYQKSLISRYAMDDSCVAAVDTGDAARTAKAELLRRIRNPVTYRFTVSLKPGMLAGQKVYIKAGKKRDGTFVIDKAVRMMEIEHVLNKNSGTSTITATDDLYNTRPISSVDKFALSQEFTLLNNSEAQNIRAGSEVDLRIALLKKNYT